MTLSQFNARLLVAMGMTEESAKLVAKEIERLATENERLQNIVTIQQKQIERLMDARDAEQVKVAQLTQALSHYANHPPPHPAGPISLDVTAAEDCKITHSTTLLP